ncbi:MAG: M15 family metallopeptidase [Clostridiales bacterium]|nr:M15 family metallopeptidase [Clostridiales bacterium]
MKKIKNRKSVIILLLFLLVFAGALVFITLKPDTVFLIKQRITQSFDKAEVKAVSYGNDELTQITYSEIERDSNFIIDNSLMLINQENTLSDSFSPNIGEYKDSGVIMDKGLFKAYEKMANEIIEKFDDKLYIMSAYRDSSEQEDISQEKKGEGTAMPEGASEHQAGLALDVYVKGFAGLGFLKSEVGQYVNEKCWEYGFIIRYPSGKTNITKVEFEPWHLRYVGFPHSEIIYRNNITFEEYIESLELGEFYYYDDYIITRQSSEGYLLPKEYKSAVISPDNMGNYIITLKTK